MSTFEIILLLSKLLLPFYSVVNYESLKVFGLKNTRKRQEKVENKVVNATCSEHNDFAN